MPLDIPIHPSGRGITPEREVPVPDSVKAMTFEAPPEIFQKDGSESRLTIDKKPVEEVKAEVKVEEPKKEIPSSDKKLEIKIEPKKEEKKEVKIEEEKKVESVLKAPKEEVKKEEKKVEATPEKKDGKEKITPISPANLKKPDAATEEADAAGFDYKDFSPQETINLKNMSRQSREFTANLIRENKKLVPLKEATYLQHEQGYTLAPEYQQARSQQYRAQLEAQCWEQSLIDIESGKKYREITGFDADGQPVFSAEKDPTTQDKIRVNNNLAQCGQVINQLSSHIQQFPQRFKEVVTRDMQIMDQAQQERFAWVADHKLLEHSIEIDGSGEHKLKDIILGFKNMLPSYMSNTPLAGVAANLFVALQIKDAELRQALASKRVAETQKEEIARAEPTSDHAITEEPSGVGKNGITPKVFSAKDFPSRG